MLAGIYNPNHSRVVLIRIQKQGKHPHLPVCPVKTQNLTPNPNFAYHSCFTNSILLINTLAFLRLAVPVTDLLFVSLFHNC